MAAAASNASASARDVSMDPRAKRSAEVLGDGMSDCESYETLEAEEHQKAVDALDQPQMNLFKALQGEMKKQVAPTNKEIKEIKQKVDVMQVAQEKTEATVQNLTTDMHAVKDSVAKKQKSGGEWLKLSGHPCSWGVDYADHPSNPPWDKVVALMSVAGYTGTDLGPVGYYDTDRLDSTLQGLKLDLVAGNIFELLHEPDQLEMILEKTKASCTTLKMFGAEFFVIVPHTVPEKEATAGRSGDAPRLPDDKWDYMMHAIKEVAKVVKSYGICCLLHPHAGSWIEYEDEMDRALKDLPADLVSLCLDTGHCTYAGMDAVEKFKKHNARIPYMQLKDIDPVVLKKMQDAKGSFWDGVTGGIFCILGTGKVDYPALLRAMKESGFSGYATIEQDFDNKIDDEERKLMYPATCSMQSVKYLRGLASAM